METVKTIYPLDWLHGEDIMEPELDSPIGSVVTDNNAWERYQDEIGYWTDYYQVIRYYIDRNCLVREAYLLGREWTKITETEIRRQASLEGISRDELVAQYS